MVNEKDRIAMTTEIKSPSGLVAAPGQDETIVSVKRNNTNPTDDCQSVSGQDADSDTKLAKLEEAIKKAVIGTSPNKNGDVRINCRNPECSGSQKETMVVNVTSGVYHCFRCELKGNYLRVNGNGKKPLAEFLYNQANRAADHAYIKRKQIKPNTIRVDNYDNWVVHFTDQDGQIQTVQFIDPAGNKRFLSKAKNNGKGPSGAAYRIDGTNDNVYVCEGAATGHSIHEASGSTVYCVGGKANFKHVLPWVKKKHQTVIVAADNDTSGDGLKAARKAAQANNLKIVWPSTTGHDFNDMVIDAGLDAVKTLLENPVDPGPDAEETNQWDQPMDMKTTIFQTPDPMPWLITERVPKGRGIILTGLGGSSKTRCLYTMAMGCVTGTLSWNWKVETTGKAVLVLTEDTAQDVHRTVYSMSLDLDDNQKNALANNLVIYPLAGKDTRLMVKTRTGAVEKSKLYQSLEKKIIALGDVVFIGLDPALSVSEGDELDQGHQRALGKMADDLAVKTEATVCLVAHATKGSLIKQELSSHNSRGGGAITDAVRAEYSMRNMTIEEASQAGITDVEERKRHVQLVCTKGNAIPPAAFVPVWLRRDDFGNLSEVNIEMNGKGTLTDRDMEILKVHSEIGVNSPPKLADWRAECIKRGLITGKTGKAQEQAMKRVLDKLKNAGSIKHSGLKGIWVQTQ